MLITFDVVAVVRSRVRTTRTLDHIGGPDLCLASREVGEENFFLLAVFAGETEIPLAGGQRAHCFGPSIFEFLVRGTGLRCLLL